MNDSVSRKRAIDAVYDAFCYAYCDNCGKEMNEDLCGDCHRKYQNWSASKKIIEKVINNLPPAQPDNQTNLCDSCNYSYPDCPSKNDDVIFGNGIGNDNICACNKYKPSAQPEQRWIPVTERLPEENMWTICQNDAGAMMIGKYDIEFGWMFPAYFDGIVAWMPRPEPYKAGRKADG